MAKIGLAQMFQKNFAMKVEKDRSSSMKGKVPMKKFGRTLNKTQSTMSLDTLSPLRKLTKRDSMLISDA